MFSGNVNEIEKLQKSVLMDKIKQILLFDIVKKYGLNLFLDGRQKNTAHVAV